MMEPHIQNAIALISDHVRYNNSIRRINGSNQVCSCFLCVAMNRLNSLQPASRPQTCRYCNGPVHTNEFCPRFLEQLLQAKLDSLSTGSRFTMNAIEAYSNGNIDAMEEADDDPWLRGAEHHLPEGHELISPPFPEPTNNNQRFPDEFQSSVAQEIQYNPPYNPVPLRQPLPFDHQVSSDHSSVQQVLYPEQIPPRPLSSMPFTPEPEYDDISPANSPEPQPELSRNPQDHSYQQPFPVPQLISGEVAPNRGYVTTQNQPIQQLTYPQRQMEPPVAHQVPREATSNQPAPSMSQGQSYLQRSFRETTHGSQNNIQLVPAQRRQSFPASPVHPYPRHHIPVPPVSSYRRKIYPVRPSIPFNQHNPHMPQDYVSHLISANTRLSPQHVSQQVLVPSPSQDNPNEYQQVPRLPLELFLEPTPGLSARPTPGFLGHSFIRQQDSPARQGHPYLRQINSIAGRGHSHRSQPVSPVVCSRSRRYIYQQQRTPNFEVNDIILAGNSRLTPDEVVQTTDDASYSSSEVREVQRRWTPPTHYSSTNNPSQPSQGTSMDNLDSDNESENNEYDDNNELEDVDIDSEIEAMYDNDIPVNQIEAGSNDANRNQSRNDVPLNDEVIDLDPPENLDVEVNADAQEEPADAQELMRPRSPISPDRQVDFGDCPICLETLGNRRVAATNCGHVFCHDCLRTNVKEEPRCPSCRRYLGPGDIIPLFLYERLIPLPPLAP